MSGFLTLSLIIIILGTHSGVLCASEPVFNEKAIFVDDDEWDHEEFGYSVALADGYLVIGARRDRPNGQRRGTVFVYDSATGELLHELAPPPHQSDFRFGFAVAAGDGVVAVGTPEYFGSGDNSGIVHVFNIETGSLIYELLPDEVQTWDRFGYSLSISEGRIAVGSLYDDVAGNDVGAVYIFDATDGSLQRTIRPTQSGIEPNFGNSVAIDAGLVVVGADRDDEGAENSGAVYVFDMETGVQIHKLLPNDPAIGKTFGTAVAIEGGKIVVGNGGDDAIESNAGSVYIFDTQSGQQLWKLTHDDPIRGDRFGASVEIENGIIAVGMSYSGTEKDRSAIHLFNARTTRLFAHLQPHQRQRNTNFSRVIAMNGGEILAGDTEYNFLLGTVGRDQDGAAFLFDMPCEADLTCDRVLDVYDLYLFIGAFIQNDFLADFDANGLIDIFDVFEYIDRFNSGC